MNEHSFAVLLFLYGYLRLYVSSVLQVDGGKSSAGERCRVDWFCVFSEGWKCVSWQEKGIRFAYLFYILFNI